MKKTVTILVGLFVLLLLAQCKKEKSEEEVNQELAIEAIQFIDDNLQSQFDRLSGKSTPEVMAALAEWLVEQEGVVAAVPDDHWVMITYVDGTEASVEVYDQTIKPDVANNLHSEGYDASLSEVAFLSAGKQQNSNVVGSQKVLIFDAFPHLDPEIDAGSAIYSIFQDAGCQEIDHPIEGQCTIDLLRNMSQYGYIQLITHGSGTDGFATGEAVTSENCLSHMWDRANRRVRVGYFAYKYENGIEYKDRFFVVTTKFIENLRNDFDNSIVFNFACDGFVEDEGVSVKTAFMDKKAAAYFGFDDENHINHGYQSSSRLVRRLLAGYTVGEAFEYVVDENWECVDYYSEDAETGEEIFEYTTCLHMDGATDVAWYEIPPFPEGAVNGLFTVNDHGGRVCFAHGNLQYQASTHTWRFAPNQYDHIGVDNTNASSNYAGWIDLFCWGTSGWDSGAQEYQPYAQSTYYQSYYTGGSPDIDLTGDFADADWAYHNPISNGGQQARLWRCLTHEEYIYMMETRPDASQKYAYACVNGVNGLVILPDNWFLPNGLTFTPQAGSWSDNSYTVEEWARMESSGAVFLPTTGTRQGTSVFYVDGLGDYWSSTANDAETGHSMSFFNGNVYPGDCRYRYLGTSVRPVHAMRE